MRKDANIDIRERSFISYMQNLYVPFEMFLADMKNACPQDLNFFFTE